MRGKEVGWETRSMSALLLLGYGSFFIFSLHLISRDQAVRPFLFFLLWEKGNKQGSVDAVERNDDNNGNDYATN